MMPRLFMTRTILLLLVGGVSLSGCGDHAATSKTDSMPTQMTQMDRGAILYKRCRACHTLGQRERNKVGPNLWNIFGQQAGSRNDFNYSSAMSASDLIWTDETLSAYLERPSAYMPGNRMSFAGLRDPDDRDAVIAYLKAKTSEPLDE